MITKNDCPRCGTKSVALNHAESPGSFADFFENGSRRDAFAICGYCGRGLVLTFLQNARSRKPLEIAPSPTSVSAPAHSPRNVANFYRQAMNNLPGNPDAAGSMFRKALESALKSKFPDMTGDLFGRIEQAQEEQKLPPAMAEWAHRIRLLGNDAAHGEEPTSEESARELSKFTQLVLLYLFTLPGMMTESQPDRPPARASVSDGEADRAK